MSGFPKLFIQHGDVFDLADPFTPTVDKDDGQGLLTHLVFSGEQGGFMQHSP